MPWMLLVALVLLVAAYAITSSMAPKQERQKPAQITDFEFPQFEEGTPEAVVFGDCWTPDWMVLSVSHYEVEEIYADSGGKK
jgi:hypothetical protein